MQQQLRMAGLPLSVFIDSVTDHPPQRVPGLAIFLTADARNAPQALLHNLKHNKILHAHNVILTTSFLDTPSASPEQQFELRPLGPGFYSAIVRFGFAEDPDIPARLRRYSSDAIEFDPMQMTFFASTETIVAGDRFGMAPWRDKLFAFLARNAQRATAYFAIPGNRLVEIGSHVEI
jgi:KUP system potassium uptake protein